MDVQFVKCVALNIVFVHRFIVEIKANSQEILSIYTPGVQVWNADYRQEMVHQSSLCYKDLTLRHFLCHQQVLDVQVK